MKSHLTQAITGAKLGFGLHYWNVNPANAQRILQVSAYDTELVVVTSLF